MGTVSSVLSKLGKLGAAIVARFPNAAGAIVTASGRLLKKRPEVVKAMGIVKEKIAKASKTKILVASAAALGGAVAVVDLVNLEPEELMAFLASLDEAELAEFVNELGLSGPAANTLLSAVRELQKEGSDAEAGFSGAMSAAGITGRNLPVDNTSTDAIYGVSQADMQPIGMAIDVGEPPTWSQDQRQQYTRAHRRVLGFFGNSFELLEDVITVFNMSPTARQYLNDEVAFRP